MSYKDNPVLVKKIDLLPDRPGSYQMKDKDGTIIYVGKAKSLVKRVKQYFTHPQEGKVMRMVMEIDDFDIIETATEKEALLLEINLIHRYRPKYNILLMDNRSYPYIALKKNSDPYLKIARSDNEKGYYYFGPFPNAGAAYKTIDLLNRIYPLRKCRNIPSKACIYYYMGQCLAPCIQKTDPQVQKELTDDIRSFLNGDTKKVTSQINQKMKAYADNLEFEKANECKKLLEDIESTTQKQQIVFQDKIDRDVIAYSIRDGYICIVFLLYRNGVLLGKNQFVEELEDDVNEVLENVIVQFYEKHPLPKQIIIPNKELKDILSETLKVDTVVPQRGKLYDLLYIGLENAKQMLDQHFQTARLNDDVLLLLEELRDKLGLKKTPLDIELYDNSHTMGYDCVGAMVKYINGEKAPEMYRKYKIKQENSQDDLASMREVLTRRMNRLKEGKEKMPDLIIVDGGENQCNVALEVKDESGLDIAIAGLAKNDKHETDSLINADTGEVIELDRHSPLFFLLMRMQDEVHRYAITYHRSLRNKSVYQTIYDGIPGIGKKKKEKLLSIYPTTESLEGVKIDELTHLVPKDAAEEILRRRDAFFSNSGKK